MTERYSYSIIIPHKNIPELLERCLASIPVRDDVQVIVVDDNSDPAVVDFEKFPGIGRKNTEVIFAKNEDERKGAGYARNIGMAAARGKWLVFADADDFFLPAVGDMMDKYRDDEADIVYFSNTACECDTLAPLPDPSGCARSITRYLETGDADRLRYSTGVPWSKFVKRSLAEHHNLVFEEVPHSNDMWFSYTAGFYARQITADATPIYCYTQRSSSLTGRRSVSWESELTRFNVSVRIKRFLDEKGKGSYFEGIVPARWKRLMRIDRKKAKALLSVVREVTPAHEVRRIKRKMALDPVVMPFRKIFSKSRR